MLGVGKGEELLVPCKMFAHPQVPIIRTMISMIMMKLMMTIILKVIIIQDKLKFRWTFNI